MCIVNNCPFSQFVNAIHNDGWGQKYLFVIRLQWKVKFVVSSVFEDTMTISMVAVLTASEVEAVERSRTKCFATAPTPDYAFGRP